MIEHQIIKTLNEFQQNCEEFIDFIHNCISEYPHLNDQFLKLENIAIYSFYDMLRSYEKRIKNCRSDYLNHIASLLSHDQTKLLADLYHVSNDLKKDKVTSIINNEILKRINYIPYRLAAFYHNLFLGSSDLYAIRRFKWILNRHQHIGKYLSYLFDNFQDKIINYLKNKEKNI